jgi:hypothetical protein
MGISLLGRWIVACSSLNIIFRACCIGTVLIILVYYIHFLPLIKRIAVFNHSMSVTVIWHERRTAIRPIVAERLLCPRLQTVEKQVSNAGISD